MRMLVLSNSTAQTLAVGQSLIFDSVVFKANECLCCHRKNSPSVKLMKKNHAYTISFHANIGPSGGAVSTSLILRNEGDNLPETSMIAPAIADGTFANVSAGTIVANCCCETSRITVTNNGTVPVTVAAGSSLVIS